MTTTATATNKGVQWIKGCRPDQEFSELGMKVAGILDRVFRGIYHRQNEVLHKRVQWDNPNWIEVVTSKSFATYDGNELTQLVILCHDDCIRLEIDGASNGYVRLMFSPRKRPTSSIFDRHPTIEQAIESVRG